MLHNLIFRHKFSPARGLSAGGALSLVKVASAGKFFALRGGIESVIIKPRLKNGGLNEKF